MLKHLKIALAICGGMLAGLGLAYFISPKAKPPASPVTASTIVSERTDLGPMERRVEALEAQLQQQRERAQATGDAAVQVMPVPGLPPPELRSQLAGEQQAQEAETLMNHDREPVVAAWAGSMRKTVSDALVNGSRDGAFSFGAVDCRTSTCLVSLKWAPGVDEPALRRSLAIRLNLPCATRIHAPEDTASGLESKLLIFGCRAEER